MDAYFERELRTCAAIRKGRRHPDGKIGDSWTILIAVQNRTHGCADLADRHGLGDRQEVFGIQRALGMLVGGDEDHGGE
jgi:hypothetical protein